MAIKKLQNDYTTPEQSKRLLELGLPADSADCRYENNWSHVETHKPVYTMIMHGHPIHNDDLSCWSVGRLLEIAWICGEYSQFIKGVCRCFYLTIKCGIPITSAIIAYLFEKNKLDFSKLED